SGPEVKHQEVGLVPGHDVRRRPALRCIFSPLAARQGAHGLLDSGPTLLLIELFPRGPIDPPHIVQGIPAFDGLGSLAHIGSPLVLEKSQGCPARWSKPPAQGMRRSLTLRRAPARS